MIPILGQERHELGGLKAEVATIVKRAVRGLLTGTLQDQKLHAECVAAGQFHFRQAFMKDLGGFFGKDTVPCADLANMTYGFLQERWGAMYPDYSAAQFLDNVYVNTGPTAKEIEDAWEVEIGSSESAMRQMYEGSARVRKGPLEGMGLKGDLEKVH